MVLKDKEQSWQAIAAICAIVAVLMTVTAFRDTGRDKVNERLTKVESLRQNDREYMEYRFREQDRWQEKVNQSLDRIEDKLSTKIDK